MKDRCWQCGKRLALPYFDEVRDNDSNVLRVHKVCKADAEIALGIRRGPVESPMFDGRSEPGSNRDE